MGLMRAPPLSPWQHDLLWTSMVPGGSSLRQTQKLISSSKRNSLLVLAKLEDRKGEEEKQKEEESSNSEQRSPFGIGSIMEALDFSSVRSAEDARLLEEAAESTKSGGRMTREQYGALRRKIGGTYKDFFKSYVDVDGEYVDEGWVDKTCKICKKDTSGEARQVDKLGRYAHVACLNNKSKPGNFFTRLFSNTAR